MKSGKLRAGAEDMMQVSEAEGWNIGGKVESGRLRAGAVEVR